jgi:hypothetical protein
MHFKISSILIWSLSLRHKIHARSVSFAHQIPIHGWGNAWTSISTTLRNISARQKVLQRTRNGSPVNAFGLARSRLCRRPIISVWSRRRRCVNRVSCVRHTPLCTRKSVVRKRRVALASKTWIKLAIHYGIIQIEDTAAIPFLEEHRSQPHLR